jgi:hypothetical protein
MQNEQFGGKRDFHSFPREVENYSGRGKVSEIVGGDGLKRQLLEIPGGYQGKRGNFEFIKEADGSINHRYFRANGG